MGYDHIKTFVLPPKISPFLIRVVSSADKRSLAGLGIAGPGDPNYAPARLRPRALCPCALMTSFVWAYIDHRGIVKDPDELVDLEDYVRKRGFKQRCSSGKH